jgi:hypothetical protein
MKKIYTLLLVFVTAVTLGQVREDKIERLKALRVAYISEKLNLSSEEAQRFWPVFNQFDDKQLELQKQKRQLMNKLRPENSVNLSEKETTDLMAEDDKIEQELQSNRQQLVKKLQGVIPNKKILMLRQIEIEFKQKLLNQMKNRKEGRFRR